MQDPLIYEIKNSLTKEFCSHVIEKFENQKEGKHPGYVFGYEHRPMVDVSVKTTTDFHVSLDEDWKYEDKVFFDSLSIGHDEFINHISVNLNAFMAECVYATQNIVDSGYQIQRYDPGGYYNWHHDSNMSNVVLFENERKTPGLRSLTYIWYLNDIENDGENEFINGVKIKPETGKLIFFPATWTYFHRGVPPLNETKYIVTGWMTSHHSEDDDVWIEESKSRQSSILPSSSQKIIMGTNKSKKVSGTLRTEYNYE